MNRNLTIPQKTNYTIISREHFAVATLIGKGSDSQSARNKRSRVNGKRQPAFSAYPSRNRRIWNGWANYVIINREVDSTFRAAWKQWRQSHYFCYIPRFDPWHPLSGNRLPAKRPGLNASILRTYGNASFQCTYRNVKSLNRDTKCRVCGHFSQRENPKAPLGTNWASKMPLKRPS